MSPISSGLNAVAAAAQRLAMPVLIGTFEGERAFIGIRQAASVVRSIRDEYDVPIFLNADHTHLCRRQSTRLEARSGQCMAETTGADPATPSSKLGAR